MADYLKQSPSSNAAAASGANTPYGVRPGLSRSNSINYVDTDDAVTGLSLLDALVVLDSHLDLARRKVTKKGQEWRNQAASTAISMKKQAEEVINQRIVRKRITRSNTANANDNNTDEDRIDLDRELAKFRLRISKRVDLVRTKWRDQRVVSLRDKVSFFFGVQLVLVSALLVGFRPHWIPNVYTALSLYLLPIRVYEYKKKHYALFLADLCYIVNIMCLVYLWIFPTSPILFVACYCLSHGPLCTAIATWRNSLVFHSVDKVTSLFIHVYPPFVFTVLRHFFPNVEQQYPALAQLPHLNVWRSLVFSSVAYLAWQIAYYYGIIVARKEKIEKEGRMTSFTYMLNSKRSWIGKTLAKIPPAHREASFMGGQFVYTIVTMAPSAIWLYDSKLLSVIWIWGFFSVSVWNGASFYFRVMANFKDVAALKKELDDLQKEAEGRKTPASVASYASTEPGDLSLGTPAFGASTASPSLPAASPGLTSSMREEGQSSRSGESKSISSGTAKKDRDVPDMRLDDSGSGEGGSDTSAVVVEAEDGIEVEVESDKKSK